MRRLLAAAVLAILIPASAAAQWPPERTKNVKVIPSDIPVRALI